jgi:methyl-accepting chemotaxis protein
MSEPINELRLIRSTVEALADKLGKTLSALNDITESVNNLRKGINELGISEVGKEQALKELDRLVQALNGYVKDAIVKELNVTVSNLTRG